MRTAALLLLLACAGPPPAVPAPPTQWLGTWRGPLLRGVGANLQPIAQMELTIGPATDRSVRWCLTYENGDRRDVRDYELRTVDAAAGRFAIDERNGIVLPARHCHDTLTSVFTVQGSTLVTRYVFGGDHIDFELESFDQRQQETTGQDVTVQTTVAVQRARLRRVP